jgi:hypothetical protein
MRNRKPARAAAFHDGAVHLCARMCSTCIFLPGNLMDLEPGRVKQMVADSLRKDSAIICHATLGTDHPAVCRGFFDRHSRDVFPLRLAVMLERLRMIEPPNNSGGRRIK